MGVVTELPGHVEVLAEAPVVVARGVGAVAGQDPAAPLELPPVAAVVAALDLVGGGGRTPEEVLGEGGGHAGSSWSSRVRAVATTSAMRVRARSTGSMHSCMEGIGVS